MFASIRCHKLKTRAALTHQEHHGKRLDIPKRPDGTLRADQSCTSENLAWTSGGSKIGKLDLGAALDAKIRKDNLQVRKNAAVALHILAVVSPEWLSKDLQDPKHLKDPKNNPRIKQLFQAAGNWAEKEFGKGSLFGIRYDVDEKGSGVVDLFVAPVRKTMLKSGKIKQAVSTEHGLQTLQKKYKRKLSYEALQDSWAAHAQAHLSKELQRGIPKPLSRRNHLHCNDYAVLIEKARQEARQEFLGGPLSFLTAPKKARLDEARAQGFQEAQIQAIENLKKLEARKNGHIAHLYEQKNILQRNCDAWIADFDQEHRKRMKLERKWKVACALLPNLEKKVTHVQRKQAENLLSRTSKATDFQKKAQSSPKAPIPEQSFKSQTGLLPQFSP